jgi:hypothetical protein
VPTQTLDLSNVISVTISLTPAGLQIGNINTCALFSSETPSGWAGGQTFAIYTNATQVATDFGANSSAFAIATAFFAQTPNPVGTNGYLVIVPLLSGPELVTAAILRTINQVYYFGVLVDAEYDANPSGFAALVAYVQTLDKVFFYTSSNIADLNPSSILDNVRSAGDFKTRCFYYGNALLNGASVQQTQIFSAAYAGRALSTDFTGSLTLGAMGLKQLATISPDQTISQTNLAAAKLAGVDVYVPIANFPAMIEAGANEYFDQVYAREWLKFALEIAGFDYLALTSTKVPQTERGMTGLKDAYRQVCNQAVINGYAAAGSWQSATTFGPSTDLVRNIADVGFYIYSLPIAQQSQAQRQQRISPLVQIAIKEAGAIEQSSVLVAVNP